MSSNSFWIFFSPLFSSGKCTMSKTVFSLSQNELHNISAMNCTLNYESTNKKILKDFWAKGAI